MRTRHLHTGVRLLLGEVAGEAQVRDAHVAVLVEQNVGGLEVAVDDVARVHVLQAEHDLGGVELDLVVGEDAVLREVVVEVAAVHEVQDEAEFVGRVECVGHAHDERGAVLEEAKAKGGLHLRWCDCERVMTSSKSF